MARRDVEAYLHSFSDSVPEGGVWSSRSGCFTSTERTVVSIEVEVGCLEMRKSRLRGIWTLVHQPLVWPLYQLCYPGFHSRTAHTQFTKSFIYPTECTTRLKFTLKFYIKMLLHVSVNKPLSGSLLLCFAKVMFIKITSLWIQFGRVAAATRQHWIRNEVF